MSIAARSMDFAVRFERGGVWRVGSLNLAFAKDFDDVAPLRALRGLRCLSLSSTYVTDVSPLAACTELVELNLSNTSVADVSALGRLRKLELLDLGRTFVEDASPLAGCVALHTLKLPARSGAPPRAPQSREDGNGSTGVERPLGRGPVLASYGGRLLLVVMANLPHLRNEEDLRKMGKKLLVGGVEAQCCSGQGLTVHH